MNRAKIILLGITILLAGCGSGERGSGETEPSEIHFSKENLHSWTSPTGEMRITTEGARLIIADRSSCFLSPRGLRIDASTFNHVEIRIAVDPPGSGATLFWTDDGSTGFVSKWKRSLPDNGNVIDLSGNRFWKDTIDRILILPNEKAKSATLTSVTIRPANIAEKLTRAWNGFWKTELREQYSVNGIIGAHAGPVPFVLIVGILSLVIPLIFALGRGGDISAAMRRTVYTGLAVGALLVFFRNAIDLTQIISVDNRFYSGKNLTNRTAAVNPPGFFPLLLEGIRSIPVDAEINVRAEKPYPYQKAAYYLYPNRVTEDARYIISHRSPAPADSAECELLFRHKGTGSIFMRGEK